MKAFIAEDEAVSRMMLRRQLETLDFQVTTFENGKLLIDALGKSECDLVITDWMMPEADGIQVVYAVREMQVGRPTVIMATSLNSAQAKEHALNSGADGFLPKPVDVGLLRDTIRSLVGQRAQPRPYVPRMATPAPSLKAPFVGICIAASTGGPNVVRAMLAQLPAEAQDHVVMIVQHGPDWMLDAFVSALNRESPIPVHLAEDGMQVKRGRAYVAPGGRHTRLSPDATTFQLDDGPEINYVKPAADPLFQTAAEALGSATVGIVVTGLGRDGGVGCSAISQAGGTVLVQDPKTAVASGMPQTVIDVGAADQVLKLEEIPAALQETMVRRKLGRRIAR